MTARNDGGPAFPTAEVRDPDGTGIQDGSLGMSLFDYFAARAPEPPPTWWQGYAPDCSGYAMWNYQYARAMIAERERLP